MPSRLETREELNSDLIPIEFDFQSYFMYYTYFNNFNGYNHGILTFLITMSWDYIYPPSTGTAAPS